METFLKASEWNFHYEEHSYFSSNQFLKIRPIKDNQDFVLPKPMLESFEWLKKLGFFIEPENLVYVNDKLLDRPVTEYKNYNYVAWLPLERTREIPKLRINTKRQIVYVRHGTTSTISNEKFESLITSRFTTYDFTPVNGWEIMFCIDFLTGWTRSWSDSEIKQLDEYVSQGASLNTISLMLKNGMQLKEMKNVFTVPNSWIRKAYTEFGENPK